MNKNSREFIVFTSCSIVLTALGIDIMLPAFSEVRKHFGIVSETSQTANIITFFFMGQITQIFFGYLTDRLGRLPILRMGILLYILSGIAVVLSPSLTIIFFFRFTAGMGAAAVFMTSIACVRDRFSGDEMAKTMSFVMAIFLFTPVIAPALGAWILHFSTWKVVFLVPPIFAVLVFLWSFRMPESHPAERRSVAGFGETMQKIKSILKDGRFLNYVTIATIIFSILSSWVSSSERIIGEFYQSPGLFPLIFGSMGLLMAAFSYINSYLSRKLGAKKSLKLFLILYFIFSAIMVLGAISQDHQPSLLFFFIMIAFLMAFTTAADPNSSALALEHMGDKAGLAASVYGTIFFFVGSGIGAIISARLTDNITPLAISALIVSSVSLVLNYFVRKKSTLNHKS
ncbi:MAG: Bcr/CflA family efflux MFS transporter [Cytophagaceae bacterium]|nr:Bcr/CflA family efflux MFS transporter [Cytophagaceae bacterium]